MKNKCKITQSAGHGILLKYGAAGGGGQYYAKQQPNALHLVTDTPKTKTFL